MNANVKSELTSINLQLRESIDKIIAIKDEVQGEICNNDDVDDGLQIIFDTIESACDSLESCIESINEIVL